MAYHNDETAWRARTFFAYWRERMEFIRTPPISERHHEANILLFAAFDALANLWARVLRPGVVQSDRRRFGDFLAKHGGEPDVFERICVPDLWHRADEGTLPFRRDLIEIVRSCGGRRKPSIADGVRSIERDDPTADTFLSGELQAVAAETVRKGKGTTTGHEVLLTSRIGEFVYSEYRCAWIHEGRSGMKTHSFNFDPSGQGERPSYLSSKFGTPPRLGFSPPFMVKVLSNCIDGFEVEAEIAGLDPVPPDSRPRTVLRMHPDDTADDDS